MNQQEVREQVSKAYAEAIKRTEEKTNTSCCAGVVATHAGYGEEKEQFGEAAEASFGCGNPLAFAEVKEGDVVLDLGSGAGFDLLIASEKVGKSGRVIGVDMTDEMIAAGRRNVERAGATNVEIRKGLIEELPVEDNSVDWVISNCVINLSPEKERVFREIARVLKPGGRFSVSDMVVGDIPNWVREASFAYMACVAGAVSEADYVTGLKAAGLVDIATSDRQVYDAAQIEGIVEGELGGDSLPEGVLADAAKQVEGQVASVRFVGRRP